MSSNLWDQMYVVLDHQICSVGAESGQNYPQQQYKPDLNLNHIINMAAEKNSGSAHPQQLSFWGDCQDGMEQGQGLMHKNLHAAQQIGSLGWGKQSASEHEFFNQLQDLVLICEPENFDNLDMEDIESAERNLAHQFDQNLKFLKDLPTMTDDAMMDEAQEQMETYCGGKMQSAGAEQFGAGCESGREKVRTPEKAHPTNNPEAMEYQQDSKVFWAPKKRSTRTSSFDLI